MHLSPEVLERVDGAGAVMSKGTERRTVRIAPELWEAALATAEQRGEKVPDIIRTALEAYIMTGVDDALYNIDVALVGWRGDLTAGEIATGDVTGIPKWSELTGNLENAENRPAQSED